MRVKVVSGYTPLNVKHLSEQQYREYGDALREACAGRSCFFDLGWKLSDCWLYRHLEDTNQMSLPPACDVAPDRYDDPLAMVASNVVQHQRTMWMMNALECYPDTDVFVWLDYAILKQGDFTGKPVRDIDVKIFLDRLEALPSLDTIYFPGCWPEKTTPADYGANWRFVGSTHIIPRQHLPIVDEFYRYECRKFIERTKTVPLDLPIWALTELNSSLPFKQYVANHDSSQLTNFPFADCQPGRPDLLV